MLKLKSAQAPQVPQFSDVDVSRVFGYAINALQEQQNNVMLQQVIQMQQSLIDANPHITLQELQATPLGGQLQQILGSDNWVFNPDRGILGPEA